MYKIKLVNKKLLKSKKTWILITSGMIGTSIIAGTISYTNSNKSHYDQYNGAESPMYEDRIIWSDYVPEQTEIVEFLDYPSEKVVAMVFKGLSDKKYYRVEIDDIGENSEWMEIPKNGLVTINRNDFSDNQYNHKFQLCFSNGPMDNNIEYRTLFDSDCSKKQIEIFNERRKRRLESIQDKIQDNDSDFDKVKKVYDYVIRSLAYDFSPVSTSDLKNYTYCYEKWGVYYTDCAGYADIINYIFDNIDIESFKVVDNTNGHVWNVVNVDGKYYHLDATYSDTGSYYGTSKYRYFLVSDDFMRSENRWFIKEQDVSCDEIYDLENIVREKDVKYRGFK